MNYHMNTELFFCNTLILSRMWSSVALSGYSVSPVLCPGSSLQCPDCFQAQTVKTSRCDSSPGGPPPPAAPRPETAALEPRNEPHPLPSTPLPAGTEKKNVISHVSYVHIHIRANIFTLKFTFFNIQGHIFSN